MVDQSPGMAAPAPATKQPGIPGVPALNVNVATSNVHSAPSTPQMPSLPVASVPLPGMTEAEWHAAVVRQIEWYLGRENLSRDFYLRQRMTPDFWAPLEVLLQFPKMKKLGMTDVQSVASLLRDASNQILVDDLGLFVRPMWAMPMSGMLSPSAGGGGTQNEERSVLILEDVPSSVRSQIVQQAFKNLPSCPVPTSAQPEGDNAYAVVFGTADGASRALEIASGSMIVGKYAIKGHVRPEPQLATAPQAPPGMVGIPSSPRSPYSPHVMLSPLPLQAAYPYGIPPPPALGGFVQSPRFYPSGSIYPGGPSPIYGMDQGISPGAPPMTPNSMSQPGTPNGNSMSTRSASSRGVSNGLRSSASQGTLTQHGHGNSHQQGPGQGMHGGHGGMNGNRNGGNRNHNRNRRMNIGGPSNYGKGSSFNGDVNSPAVQSDLPGGAPFDQVRSGSVSQKPGGMRNLRSDRGSGMVNSGGSNMEGGRRSGNHTGGSSERRRGKGRKRNSNKEDQKNMDARRDEERKKSDRVKKEAEISTMYFPPLPGSSEAAAGVMTTGKGGGSTAEKEQEPKMVPVEHSGTSDTRAHQDDPRADVGSAPPTPRKSGESASGSVSGVAEAQTGSSALGKESQSSEQIKEEPRRRDSLTGGMSYAAILRTKGRSAMPLPTAKAPSGSISPRGISAQDVEKSKDIGESQEIVEVASEHPISTLTSPTSSSATIADSSISDTEKKEVRSRQAPSTTKAVSITSSSDEIPRGSTPKAGSVSESSPSDNDVQSIGSSVAEPQDIKAPVKRTSRGAGDKPGLSPSNSVWANKPKSVLEAAPITANPRGSGSTKTPQKTPRTITGKKDGPRAGGNAGKDLSKSGKSRQGNTEKHQKSSKSVLESKSASLHPRREDVNVTLSSNGNVAKIKGGGVSPKGAWALGGPKSLSRDDSPNELDIAAKESKLRAQIVGSSKQEQQ